MRRFSCGGRWVVTKGFQARHQIISKLSVPCSGGCGLLARKQIVYDFFVASASRAGKFSKTEPTLVLHLGGECSASPAGGSIQSKGHAKLQPRRCPGETQEGAVAGKRGFFALCKRPEEVQVPPCPCLLVYWKTFSTGRGKKVLAVPGMFFPIWSFHSLQRPEHDTSILPTPTVRQKRSSYIIIMPHDFSQSGTMRVIAAKQCLLLRQRVPKCPFFCVTNCSLGDSECPCTVGRGTPLRRHE